MLKRLFNAKRAGHAGTLDPLASGGLPLRWEKPPRQFPSSWTAASATSSPCAGRGTRQTTTSRPGDRDLRPAPDPRGHHGPVAPLHRVIEQVPPRYSAIKVQGERAYDLARDGEIVELAARPFEIHHLTLVDQPIATGPYSRPSAARAPMSAARPRYGPDPRHLWPYLRAAADPGRPI